MISAGRFFPARAAYEFLEMDMSLQAGDVVINEVMADNSMLFDEYNEVDDWVEIMNPSIYPMDVEGLFLSNDSSDLMMWELPAMELEAGGYLTIWLDDSLQGTYHANFEY